MHVSRCGSKHLRKPESRRAHVCLDCRAHAEYLYIYVDVIVIFVIDILFCDDTLSGQRHLLEVYLTTDKKHFQNIPVVSFA